MRFALGYRPCPDAAVGDTGLDDMLGAAPSAIDVPTTLDLSHLVRKIRNQNPAGTCVGFGMTGAMAACARQNGFPAFEDASALGTYVQARGFLRQLKDPMDGTTPAAAINAVGEGGFLYETELPYDPAKKNEGLKLGKGQKALHRCGLRAHRILGFAEEIPGICQKLLATGKGVFGGWQVDHSFEDWTPDKGPWSGLKGPSEGGHCMHVLDYPKGLPRFVNSWGTDVGEGGFWTVTWEVLARATSLWAIDFVPVS